MKAGDIDPRGERITASPSPTKPAPWPAASWKRSCTCRQCLLLNKIDLC
jgi:hypothetical protein